MACSVVPRKRAMLASMVLLLLGSGPWHDNFATGGRVCIAVASAAKVLPATQQALIQYMQQFAGPGLSSLVPPPEQPNPLHTPANASDSPAPAAAASERSSSSEATDGPTADVLAAVSRRQKIPHRHPIILIPPLAGVLLERKLDHRKDVPHFWCRSTSGWSLAWLSLWELLPGEFACFVDYMRRLPEASAGGSPGTSSAPEGVEVRPVQSFDGGAAITFKPLVQALELLGWQRDEDLLAHVYDFRLGPVEWAAPGSSFEQLQQQVEAASAKAGKRALLISFSLGGPYAATFLQQQVDQAWRELHVEGLISLSGFWGGTPTSLLAAVAGVWLGIQSVNQALLLQLLRAMPSLAYMMPSPQVFPGLMLAVNSATGRNYTTAELSQLLADAGAADMVQYWEQYRARYTPSPRPGVKVYCLYGTRLPTVTGFKYDTADWSGEPAGLLFGEGDGTVPAASLQMCAEWQKQAEAAVVQAAGQGAGVREGAGGGQDDAGGVDGGTGRGRDGGHAAGAAVGADAVAEVQQPAGWQELRGTGASGAAGSTGSSRANRKLAAAAAAGGGQHAAAQQAASRAAAGQAHGRRGAGDDSTVVVREYPGVVHSLLLQDKEAFQDTLGIIYEIHAGLGEQQDS